MQSTLMILEEINYLYVCKCLNTIPSHIGKYALIDLLFKTALSFSFLEMNKLHFLEQF